MKKLKEHVKKKNIKSLSSKLTKAQSQAEHTKKVIHKVTNTSSKRIEDIIVKEFPQRYIARGFRNRALLNHYVVRLAEKLKGVLPTRDNVLPLLNDIVTQRIDPETLPLYYDSETTSVLRSNIQSVFLLHTPNDRENNFPTDTLRHFKIPNKNKILNWQSNCNMLKT